MVKDVIELSLVDLPPVSAIYSIWYNFMNERFLSCLDIPVKWIFYKLHSQIPIT